MNLQNWILELRSNHETAIDCISSLPHDTPHAVRTPVMANPSSFGRVPPVLSNSAPPQHSLHSPRLPGHLPRRHAPPPCASATAGLRPRRRRLLAPNQPPLGARLLRVEAVPPIKQASGPLTRPGIHFPIRRMPLPMASRARRGAASFAPTLPKSVTPLASPHPREAHKPGL